MEKTLQKILQGKRGLVMGLANDKSIAWGIAKALHEAGAELIISYQGEALKKRAEPLAAKLGDAKLIACDVQDDQQLKQAFDGIKQEFGSIDFLIHAIAFSDRGELTGAFSDTSRGNFSTTMEVSVYSFITAASQAAKLMKDGGSMVTLTYYGAAKAIPNYNVMGVAKAALEASVRYLAADLGPKGIRVNAISAGPIKTLASAGIAGMRTMVSWNELNAPLRRGATQEDVGGSATYLVSELARGVTGEVHYVDCGYNVQGMMAMESAAENAALLNSVK